MLFWILTGALALAVSAALGLTLLRARDANASSAAYDLQVYRDQLKEVDRDRERGVLSAAEAERLRAEVSRRVLAADADLRASGAGAVQPRLAGFGLAALATIGLIGGSFWIYTSLGAPHYADLPIKARLAASDRARADRLTQDEAEARVEPAQSRTEVSEEYLALLDKLRAAVEGNGGDLRGWMLLARNEAVIGNDRAARRAQSQVIAFKGEDATADDYAFLADLMITAANGYVSSDAEAALREALERDPSHGAARFYLGHYFLQVDRPDATFRTWSALLEHSPADAPWVAPIRAGIEEVAARAGMSYQLPEAAPGPTAEDIEAMSELDAAGRDEAIRGMVARLSDRLATEGGSAAEWARLIGAYGVLGETGRAREIWAEAQQVFGDRPEELAVVRAAAEGAGVAE